MNTQLLKELLSTLANNYPFQTEEDKNSFMAQIESLDAPETPAEETPEETPAENASENASEGGQVVDLPANPAADNPPPASTANEAPEETPAAEETPANPAEGQAQ